MDRCDDTSAQKAADALDNNDFAQVKSLIHGCADDLRKSWSSSSRAEENLIEQISVREIKGKGLDLSPHYEIGGTGYLYITGFDIK